MKAHAVAVIGAGPAGVVLARRLAVSGLDVVLYSAPAERGVEGWSARTRALLFAEGCGELDALLGEPVPRSGAWGAGRNVEGVEWLAPRGAVDAALRRSAQRAGVTLIEETVAGVAASADALHIQTRSGTAQALHVVDARGRRAAHAVRGPALLSVIQAFRLPRSQPAATMIAPTSTGWCWSACRDRELWVQVVGRPRDVRVHGLQRWLAAAVVHVPAVAAQLATAVPLGGPIARAAHARLGATPADPRRWLAGEAAVALDPLSGQGTYEAIRGAMVVSTALKTTLDRGDAIAARAFVTARSEAVWAHAARTAGDFYGENAQGDNVWRELADAYVAAVPSAAAVVPHVAPRPVLRRDRIVLAPVAVTARHPRGVYEIDGLPAAELLECARGAATVDVDAIARRFSSSPRCVQNALRWLAREELMPAARSAAR